MNQLQETVFTSLSNKQRGSALYGLRRLLKSNDTMGTLESTVLLATIITRLFSIRLPQKVDAICVHAVSGGTDIYLLEEVIHLYRLYDPQWVILNGDNDPMAVRTDDKNVQVRPGRGNWSGFSGWERYLTENGIPPERIVAADPSKFTHEEVKTFRETAARLCCENVIAITTIIQFVRTVFTYTDPRIEGGKPIFFYASAPCGEWDRPAWDSQGVQNVQKNQLIIENLLKLLVYAADYPHGIETADNVLAYLDKLDWCV